MSLTNTCISGNRAQRSHRFSKDTIEIRNFKQLKCIKYFHIKHLLFGSNFNKKLLQQYRERRIR